jgi:phosphate starvation-inducible PhoH-like protein
MAHKKRHKKDRYNQDDIEQSQYRPPIINPKGRKKDTKEELDIIIGDLFFKTKTDNQNLFCELIDNKEIIVCSGPAGVGKSMLSVAKALELLKAPKNEFYKIIIATPAVEADENLGFLPGTAEEKLLPYIFSTLYLFEKMIGKDRVKNLRENDYLQILPLAFIRGMNIDNSILIAEEFQNATPRQVKTILTRIGHHSKFIISGDLEQSDRYSNKEKCGLYDAMTRLQDIDEIGIFRFDEKDIVRNKVIGKILDKYKDTKTT